MNFKKIPINQSSYIRLYEDDTFEVHCSAQGPLGANVYHFKRDLLEWKQRRSYSFVSKKYKINYEWLIDINKSFMTNAYYNLHND